MTRSRPTPVLLTLLLIIALSACGGTGAATGGSDGRLTLATPAPNSLFTFNQVIAEKLGFFKDEGLTVTLAPVVDSIPIAGLVQNGKADIGLVAATDAITAALRTDELRMPYDERTGGNGFLVGLVVPEKSGVKTVADLAGKNVGLASPDQDRAYLTAVLRKAGMTIGDVETTMVGPGSPSVAQTLESGRIAAYAGTLTDFFAFDEAGLPVRDITPEGLEGLPVGGYIVRAESLKQGDALVRFFRAMARGTYVGLERPKVAEAAARQAAPEEWGEPEKSRGLLAELAKTLAPFDGKNFGEIKADRWSNAQSLLKEAGVIDASVDLNTFLARDVLAPVNAFDRAATLAKADAWLAQNG
ncbi:ABC transporter substrate-binding protein [Spongiactinospora sp. TRM90649]|uniref:ABC transporter substrate-binding protein n=1 Tax=Spongiactinospora sp. TRM90649 TaxID=3031114 RepID=UPI0023F956CE|nr:ABC transporter substrate-binding protein [Spongiactinospora sp. TRM90649]MDF5753579.1 ABC transporter substrate-binding protein [Spongiactinospora sp. TRM90649]